MEKENKSGSKLFYNPSTYYLMDSINYVFDLSAFLILSSTSLKIIVVFNLPNIDDKSS